MRCWLPVLVLALTLQQAVRLEQAVTEPTQQRLLPEWAKMGCEWSSRQEDVTSVRCSLPAARLTITISNLNLSIDNISMECLPDAIGHVGGYRCDELQPVLAKVYADSRSAERQWMYWDILMQRCELQEPLSCLLPFQPHYLRLYLYDVPTELRPEHLAGLNFSAINLTYKAENATVREVPYVALATQPRLRTLHLRNVRLSGRWPPALEHLQDLELHDLVDVSDGAFEGLSNLERLGLKGNTIEQLNSSAFLYLSSLTDLYLSSKAMKSLPPNLLLPTPLLRELVLSDHQLQYLSREPIYGLQYLRNVTITNENMSELRLEAGTFFEFSELETLNIVSCGVRAVPADLLRGSSGLATLSLRDNQLTELPAELLATQINLRNLILARNRMQTLPCNLFKNANKLENLDLSDNVIEFLPTDIFEATENITKLNLTYNYLKQLEPKLFQPLHRLEHLLLAHNALVSADLAVFEHLSFLKTLDLSHNVITSVSDSDLMFKGTSTIIDLRQSMDTDLRKTLLLLNNNPFICDCNIYNFVRALNENAFITRFELSVPHCAAPASLHDVLLSNVPIAELYCTLDSPPCPAYCACTLYPDIKRLELNCTATPRTLQSIAPLRAVQLRFFSVPAHLTGLPPEVRFVDLSGLGVTVAPRALGRFDNVTVDLSNNNLTMAPISLLEANATVRLAGNKFVCDCDRSDSISTLERHWEHLEDGVQLRCQDGSPVEGLTAMRLCAMRNALVIGISITVFGLILGALAVLAFIFSIEIRLVLRRYEALNFLFEEPPDPAGLEEAYDAFVSFTHRDEDFVQDKLVPELEGGRRPLRLCVHSRDWEIGGMITEQIARSVSETRRTIVVMSREFLESKWGKMEFRAAHALDRVILLLRGDVVCVAKEDPELRAYLITKTYVHADDPLVWDRVRDAVLRARRPRPSAVPALPAPPTALPLPPTALPLTALPPAPAYSAAIQASPVLAPANSVTRT
ncbi:uncharacterized protein [Epargyreus clarus]|uniref:uncharacterized protein n=1 Tax=Epargyreus clarus TaxID=520877 RepID=UPI003C2ADA6F